jgi:hypothetical protein
MEPAKKNSGTIGAYLNDTEMDAATQTLVPVHWRVTVAV